MTPTKPEDALVEELLGLLAWSTPGPWEAQLAEDAFFQDINITRGDGLAVAVAVVNGDISRDEAHTNGKLIAMMPRMADAITTLLERERRLRDLLWRAMDDASISPDTWYAEARAALTGDGV